MSRPKTLPREIVDLLNAQERALSYAIKKWGDDQDFMYKVVECTARWRIAGANGYKYKNGQWKVMRDMPPRDDRRSENA